MKTETRPAIEQTSSLRAMKREPLVDPVLLGLVLVAALLRIAYSVPAHVAFGDESCYVMLAQNLFSGEGYTYYAGHSEVHFPPLFPIVLGVLHLVVRDWEFVTRAAFVIFGTAALIPVYLLGRDIHSVRVARIAAFMTALLPAFTSGILFGQTLGEPVFLFLLFMGIYTAHRASRDQRIGSYVLSSSMFCFAYLARPEGMLYFFASFGYLALYLAFRRPLALRAAAARLLIYAWVFLALASPYVIYLRAVTGEWALTTKDTKTYTTTRGLVLHDGEEFQADTWGLNDKGEVKYFSREDGPNLIELLAGPYRHRVVNDVSVNSAEVIHSISKSRLFGPILLFLSFLGLLGKSWRGERARSELFNFFMIVPVSAFLIFFIADRFLYPVLLPFIVWAAAGVDHILDWVDSTDLPWVFGLTSWRTALKRLCLVLLGAYLLSRGWSYFSVKRGEQDEVWAASNWIEQNTPADAVIMSTGPEVAFHAGRRRWLPVPYGTTSEVVEYARRMKADYVCLRGRYLLLRFNQRVDLFYNARNQEGLELVVKNRKHPRGAFVVYKVKQAGA